MATNRVYRVAVIPGDGIGKEVVPEGLRVLQAASQRYGFALDLQFHEFSSCDYYLQHGRMITGAESSYTSGYKQRTGCGTSYIRGRSKLTISTTTADKRLGLISGLLPLRMAFWR